MENFTLDAGTIGLITSLIVAIGVIIKEVRAWKASEDERNKKEALTQSEIDKTTAAVAKEMGENWARLNDGYQEQLSDLKKELEEVKKRLQVAVETARTATEKVTFLEYQLETERRERAEMERKYQIERNHKNGLERRVTAIEKDLKAVISVNSVLIKQLEAHGIKPAQYPPNITSLGEGHVD